MAGLARRVVAALALALPLVLIWSSVRTFKSLSDLRTDYLRNQVASIASRLETLDSGQEASSVLDEEFGRDLVALRIYQRDASATDPEVAPIWEGRELYRTERLSVNGVRLYRAFVPFHQAGQMQIARIDLDEASADTLLTPARQNIVLATVSGVAIMLLCAYAIWSIRRRAEMQRRHMKLENLARLGEMSAVLAHEIRNPLGTVKGFVQLAQEKGTPAMSSLLEPVLEETGRLERLVNDLLLYGRSREPAVANVNWSDIASALSPDAGSDRVFVEPHEYKLRADSDLLKQILINLVRNATESGANHVQVRPELTRDGVRIIVEDDGPGIPAAQSEKVFEPFFTTKSSGTGLGLPIAKKLVESMGGSLVISARSPRGTMAVLTLPNGTDTSR